MPSYCLSTKQQLVFNFADKQNCESQLDDDDEDTVFGPMAVKCPTSNESFKHSGLNMFCLSHATVDGSGGGDNTPNCFELD